MEEYNDEAYETLSLSDLQMDENTATSDEVVVNPSSFYQDFFGFSAGEESFSKVEEKNPNFRSNSGSFRYMRFKIASRTGSWRSRSLSVMACKSKSRLHVFMSGFRSSKFPTKMDLIDIKTRQLRSGSITKVSETIVNFVKESDGRRTTSGKKAWWRLVDVLGCSGGFERNTKVVV